MLPVWLPVSTLQCFSSQAHTAHSTQPSLAISSPHPIPSPSTSSCCMPSTPSPAALGDIELLLPHTCPLLPVPASLFTLLPRYTPRCILTRASRQALSRHHRHLRDGRSARSLTSDRPSQDTPFAGSWACRPKEDSAITSNQKKHKLCRRPTSHYSSRPCLVHASPVGVMCWWPCPRQFSQPTL